MATNSKTRPRGFYPLLFRRKALAANLDISPGTVDNWVAKKWLPKPMKLGEVVCWRRESIENALILLEEQFGPINYEGDADGENPFDDIIP